MNAFHNHTTITAAARTVPARHLIASLASELRSAGAVLAALHHYSSMASLLNAMADLQQQGVIDQDLLRKPERDAVLSMATHYLTQRAPQDEREWFESDISSLFDPPISLDRPAGGEYTNTTVLDIWTGWCMRAAQQQRVDGELR